MVCNDSRLTGLGGSLAVVNLPNATSTPATYMTTNQVKSWNGVSAGVGADGYLGTDPSNSNTYQWDERNQLENVNSPTYQFFYDAMGRRESFDEDGTTLSYLYDSLMAVQETSSNNSNFPTYNYLTMPGGEVLTATTSSGTIVPLHDILGSTVGLVNGAGSLATSYSYTPYGIPSQSGTSSSYPYLFAGMEYDSSTGLYHTLARYYSPTLQRFLSEDPMQFGGGNVNLFGYAANDPVDYSDPSGLDIGVFAAFGYCAYGFAGDFGALGSANDFANSGAGIGVLPSNSVGRAFGNVYLQYLLMPPLE